MGQMVLGYIYDFYLRGLTPAECSQIISATTTLVTELGILPHPTKSFTVQTQVPVLFGFILNGDDSLKKKIAKTVTACKLLLAESITTVQQVAELIGHSVFNFPGLEYGSLHYRELEIAKSVALKQAYMVKSSKMTLNSICKQELEWYIKDYNLPLVKFCMVNRLLSFNLMPQHKYGGQSSRYHYEG